MKVKVGSKKRRRVSAADVRKNAKEGFGGSKLYSLPEGVRDWYPEKPGRYMLNIVPYEVSSSNHPSGVDKGTVWYERTFRVHHLEGQSIVCPKSKLPDAFCPWCVQFLKLKKSGADEDTLKPFKGQMYTAYNIIDPEDSDKICVMAMSYGKFAKKLKEELDLADENDMLFFEVTKKKGRTIKARFSEKKFMGKKFLECSKIDFVPRKDMDEEAIFGKVVDLDKMLRFTDPDKLKKMFHQVDDDDEDEKPKKAKRGVSEDDDDDGEKKPKKHLKHKGKHKTPTGTKKGKVKGKTKPSAKSSKKHKSDDDSEEE